MDISVLLPRKTATCWSESLEAGTQSERWLPLYVPQPLGCCGAGENLEVDPEGGPTAATALRVMVLSSLSSLPAPPYQSGE